MAEPNLNFPLPSGIKAVLEAAEGAECWVVDTPSFRAKQMALFTRLPNADSALPHDAFARRYIAATAFSSFRDNLALFHALGRRHPETLAQIIGNVTGNGLAFVPEEHRRVLRWRLEYATAFSVLARVFAGERLEMINTALRRL